MNTLKEILVDAARYRGLKKMLDDGLAYVVSERDLSMIHGSKDMGEFIDEELALGD